MLYHIEHLYDYNGWKSKGSALISTYVRLRKLGGIGNLIYSDGFEIRNSNIRKLVEKCVNGIRLSAVQSITKNINTSQHAQSFNKILGSLDTTAADVISKISGVPALHGVAVFAISKGGSEYDFRARIGGQVRRTEICYSTGETNRVKHLCHFSLVGPYVKRNGYNIFYIGYSERDNEIKWHL